VQAQCRPSHSRTARGGKSTGVLGVVQPDPDFGRKTAMRHAAAADSEIDVFDAASGAHLARVVMWVRSACLKMRSSTGANRLLDAGRTLARNVRGRVRDGA